MKNIFSIFRNKGDKKYQQIKNDLDILEQEIKDVCTEIEHTDMWFRTESDIDLIDACLYQREYLNARYKYLIKKIRNFHNGIKTLELSKNSEKCIRKGANHDE